MEELLQLTLLYDFYGELLTQKQKLVYELYHQNDWSLSEIAQELSISRQAVRDQLKRTEKILQEYEKKLGLYHKRIKILKLIENLDEKTKEKIETLI